MEHQYLTTAEVAEMLHATKRNVGLWRRKNMIRSIRCSNGYLFKPEWVDEFVDRFAGMSVTNEEKCDLALALLKHRQS